MSPRTRVLILLTVAVFFIGSHACGGLGPTPSPTALPATATPSPSPTPVDPQVLLRMSGRVMEGLRSFHFRLAHRTGATPLLASLVIDEAEGDVVKPDKISVEFSGSFAGFFVKSGLVTLGDVSYMTNPLTGKWESVPADVSPLRFFDPRRGISAMLSRVGDASLLPGDSEVHRIKGTLPAEALAPLLGTTVEGTTVDVEIAIDKTEHYLIEAVLDGRVTPTEPDAVIGVITLSGFDEAVSIEAPQ